MWRQSEKPLYWDNHEAFRRLLIMGGISLVIGVFYSERASTGVLVAWMSEWFPIVMWVAGLLVLAMCFLLHPRQYSIYQDKMAVEWWHFRRKVIPFNEITQLKTWSRMGRKQLIIISQGPNYEFGWECIAPRKIDAFAERLEEALNRSRFCSGLEPIQTQNEDSRKDNKKD